MTGYFKFFTGPHGSAGRAAVVVKITADDGTVGWGQSVPIAKWSYETLETAELALRDYFAPGAASAAIRPTSPAPMPRWTPRSPRASRTGMPITRAGLDIALHDLAGKLRGQSLAELWGRRPAARSR